MEARAKVKKSKATLGRNGKLLSTEKSSERCRKSGGGGVRGEGLQGVGTRGGDWDVLPWVTNKRRIGT